MNPWLDLADYQPAYGRTVELEIFSMFGRSTTKKNMKRIVYYHLDPAILTFESEDENHPFTYTPSGATTMWRYQSECDEASTPTPTPKVEEPKCIKCPILEESLKPYGSVSYPVITFGGRLIDDKKLIAERMKVDVDLDECCQEKFKKAYTTKESN